VAEVTGVIIRTVLVITDIFLLNGLKVMTVFAIVSIFTIAIIAIDQQFEFSARNQRCEHCGTV